MQTAWTPCMMCMHAPMQEDASHVASAPAAATGASTHKSAPQHSKPAEKPAAAAHAAPAKSIPKPVAKPVTPSHQASLPSSHTPEASAAHKQQPAAVAAAPKPTPRSGKPVMSIPRPIGAHLTLHHEHDAAEATSTSKQGTTTPISQPSARARPVSAPAPKSVTPKVSSRATPAASGDAGTPGDDKPPSTARGSSLPKKKERPQSATPKSDTPVPSYARPTAAFKVRNMGDVAAQCV
jgi:hypothetical protein